MTGPARKIKKSAVKNIVRFPAVKANSGKTIILESILESKYCLHLEFDPNVVEYFPQPETFKIADDDGETSYTPDFRVHYLSGVHCYVEVKPFERSISVHYQQLFSRFESTLHGSNSHFSVVDEIEIYAQPLLSNYEKLYQYRKRPTIDKRRLYQFMAEYTRPLSLAKLIACLDGKVSLREVYSWLALGYLLFNIREEPLTMNTEVIFNAD